MKRTLFSAQQGSPTCGREVTFSLMKKECIYKKFVNLAEPKTFRINNITKDVRPSNCNVIAYVALG